MLEERIQKDLMEAMKSHDTERVNAIRSIKTAIQNEKTSGSFHELTDADVLKIIQKLSKQRQEAADIYSEAGRKELAENELKEKSFIDEYLPKMMTEDELTNVIKSIVDSLGATTMKDMGNVMKTLSAQYSGQYDGKTASTIIRGILS